MQITKMSPETLKTKKRIMELEQRMKQEIENRDREIETRNREIENNNREIEARDREIENNNREIEARDREIRNLSRRVSVQAGFIRVLIGKFSSGKMQLLIGIFSSLLTILGFVSLVWTWPRWISYLCISLGIFLLMITVIDWYRTRKINTHLRRGYDHETSDSPQEVELS